MIKRRNLHRSGLVGRWAMRGNAKDSSVNKNDGAVTGATLTTDRFGIANRAYNYNGSHEIIIPYNAAYTIGTSFSVAVWAKVGINTLTSFRYLAGAYETTGNNRSWAMAIESNSTGKFIVVFAPFGTTSSLSTLISNFVVDNKWHLFAFTYQNGNVNIYVDGINISYTGTPPETVYNSTSNIHIGSIVSSANRTVGDIGEFSFYNRRLGINEYVNMYRSAA